MRWLAVTCALSGAGCLELPVRAPDASFVAPELTRFGFRAADNPGLVADVIATIDRDQIHATTPFDAHVVGLVAFFETTAGTVTLDTVVQASGSTPNDFVEPRTYVVATPDGQAKSYEVHVRLPAFHDAVSFAAGMQPVAIDAADVDGDGKPDLVFASYMPPTLTILRNTTPAGASTATFAPPLVYTMPAGALDLELADLTGDGKPEVIASAAAVSSVLVYPNQSSPGAPMFGPSSAYAVGMNPIGVALGDLDSNGALDVVVANCTGSSISVLLGNGTGTFAVSRAEASTGCPLDVGIADLDGDLVLDIVSTSANASALTLSRGIGAGMFAPNVAVATVASPGGLATADFDGDRVLDVAVANLGSMANPVKTNTVLRNTSTPGQPAFTSAATLATPDSPLGIEAADITGDGRPDLISANTGNSSMGTTVSIYLGATSPGPAAPLEFYPRKDLATAKGPYDLALADLNGDSLTDIVVVAQEDDVVNVFLAR